VKTLVEYVDFRGNEIKEEFLQEVHNLYETLKNDPEFRGPTGYGGKDGDQGPQGVRGKIGPMPMFERDGTKIRFQTAMLINEETGEEIPQFSEWVDLKGESGDKGEVGPQGEPGLIGEQGQMGEQGPKGDTFTFDMLTEEQLESIRGPRGLIGETGPVGPIGEAGPQGERGLIGETGPVGSQGEKGEKGDKGEALTFDMLSEAQRQLLVGPSGPSGPKGDTGAPGKFPAYEYDKEKERYRFQVSEDVTDPWGPWLALPQGPQGSVGPKGDKGDAGPQGPAGKDFDPEIVKKQQEDLRKMYIETLNKHKRELVAKIDAKIGELRSADRGMLEMVVPIGAIGGVDNAGRVTQQFIAQEIEQGPNFAITRSGTPIYIDNPVRASARGDTYDANDPYLTARADSQLNLADGLWTYDNDTNQSLLVRVGVVTIDRAAVADGQEFGPSSFGAAGPLDPGHYYYLDNASPGTITVNYPLFGIAQYVGQAINHNELFVNMTIDPHAVNEFDLNYVDRVAPTSETGAEGDRRGDVIVRDGYMYQCIRDYDPAFPSQVVWVRNAIDSNW